MNKYNNIHPGTLSFKGFKHKKTKEPFKDIDYLELLGRHVIKLENDRENKKIPLNYNELGFDVNVCSFAKNIVKMIDDKSQEKMSRKEIAMYIANSINLEE